MSHKFVIFRIRPSNLKGRMCRWYTTIHWYHALILNAIIECIKLRTLFWRHNSIICVKILTYSTSKLPVWMCFMLDSVALLESPFSHLWGEVFHGWFTPSLRFHERTIQENFGQAEAAVYNLTASQGWSADVTE